MESDLFRVVKNNLTTVLCNAILNISNIYSVV